MTAKFGSEDKHTFNKHEPVEETLTCAFTIIKISDNLQGHIQQRGLELTTSKAIFDGDKSRKLNEEARQRNDEALQRQEVLAQQQKEEQVRQREAQRKAIRFAKQAKENALSFLSFKYGRSVEERKGVGNSWATGQLIEAKPATHANEAALPTGLGADTKGTTAAQSLPSELNTNQRITRQTLDLRKAAQGAPSPDQPDFASLNPNSAHGPTQPLTPAETPTYDSDFPSDTEEMSTPNTTNKQIYPESGGAANAIKDVIQNLFTLQQHVRQFQPEHQEGVTRQVENVAKSLSTLDEIVTDPSNPLHNIRVAPEIIEYVDDARNPDIFSREFVELVQRGNSVLNGKQRAFRGFSGVFAKRLKESFEGLDEEVDLVMGNAGMEEREGVFVDKVRDGNGNGNGSAA